MVKKTVIALGPVYEPSEEHQGCQWSRAIHKVKFLERETSEGRGNYDEKEGKNLTYLKGIGALLVYRWLRYRKDEKCVQDHLWTWVFLIGEKVTKKFCVNFFVHYCLFSQFKSVLV